MSDKTSSGEPTFGVAKNQTVKVRSKSGTDYVAYHDGETWYEGHHDEDRCPVQIAEAPVSLVSD